MLKHRDFLQQTLAEINQKLHTAQCNIRMDPTKNCHKANKTHRITEEFEANWFWTKNGTH